MSIASWYHSLEFRERIVLGAGMALIIASILYAMLWSPMHSRVKMLRSSIDAQEQQLEWMDVTARELKLLRQELKEILPIENGDNRSLLTEMDIVARRTGVGRAVTRMEPTGSNTAKVQLINADFNALVQWLVELDAFGITVESIRFSSSQSGGRVDGSVAFRQGGQ